MACLKILKRYGHQAYSSNPCRHDNEMVEAGSRTYATMYDEFFKELITVLAMTKTSFKYKDCIFLEG